MVLRFFYIVCLFVFEKALLRAEANRKTLKVINKAEDIKQSYKQS